MNQSKISIIGGADGPTSIYVAGKAKKRLIKNRMQNIIYRFRRKKVEKKVVTNTHTLKEVVQYARCKYGLVEIPISEIEYIEQQKSIKEGLILQHKPEILGELASVPRPDVSNETSIREYLEKIEAQRKRIAQLPESAFSMDFHLYRIVIGDDVLEMGIDYFWNVFGISYSGNQKVLKQFKKISRDLYLYYGVNENDIKNKTKRYSMLVTELSS